MGAILRLHLLLCTTMELQFAVVDGGEFERRRKLSSSRRRWWPSRRQFFVSSAKSSNADRSKTVQILSNYSPFHFLHYRDNSRAIFSHLLCEFRKIPSNFILEELSLHCDDDNFSNSFLNYGGISWTHHCSSNFIIGENDFKTFFIFGINIENTRSNSSNFLSRNFTSRVIYVFISF